ncbi:MAG: NAD(P)/FAD-dependent oxidoreductase [Pseudomonadota bacterium]
MTPTPLQTIIIGAGMSGLLAAIRMKQAGVDFVVLEKSDDVGGTWLDNAYPGSGCDVPSHLYSYSFAGNPDWSRLFARQPEILAYFRAQADRFGVRASIAFGTDVSSADWDEATARWTVTAKDGRRWSAPVLIVATGQLNRPSIPKIAGADSFSGPQFHTARWDAGVPLAGKRIGVIGTGASAIQVVPEIAADAAHLTVFQRSPHWVIPREDKPVGDVTRTLFARVPLLRKAVRALIWLRLEQIWKAIERPGGAKARQMEQLARDYLAEQVSDPELRAKLTPDFPIGCKRTLVSDDYFAALTRDNVTLETRAIDRIEPAGIRLADGTPVDLDVIVWATGFETHGFVAPIAITGPDGSLSDAWKAGASAYRGTTVAGFPNLFLLYGPNTNLGHNSIIFMVERQMEYALPAILKIARGEARRIAVRPEAHKAYNDALQARLATTSWAGGCGSWYKTDGGVMPNNWAGNTAEFARLMQRFDEEAYQIA